MMRLTLRRWLSMPLRRAWGTASGDGVAVTTGSEVGTERRRTGHFLPEDEFFGVDVEEEVAAECEDEAVVWVRRSSLCDSASSHGAR